VSAARAIPMIAYEDASSAAEWLARAFGFRELERFNDERGVPTDIVMDLEGAEVIVGHPSDAYVSPRRHAETCADARAWLDQPYIVDGVVMEVADVDAHLTHARAAGARLLSELETNEFQRQYRVEDLEGHRWMFATPVRR
jgi:PhnB protein